ncbi:uncharacterized protein LOC110713593 [Chenopodium quinoa]|uniref:uncharacterized protein LOC110713593 n=1 Tax=Chenopodium quinoa TaxID=63459 RepID=UPI000B79120E|nr:uncharacterized protein LOC110713593 [Chenopodium quinoa]
MQMNRQMKCSWVAKQFIEVFKTRPHWPAKEIIECIRRAYKVVVKREFAYRVKYAAHILLHGSMHEHYQKVSGYLAELRKCSPGSVSELVTVMPKQPPPVFQRLFMCFEGLMKGWREGCRKVISVDACFFKTFLGGQLLCAVGRDANDQMYPIAWAVTEGENNLSWEWFFIHLVACLDLGEGEGLSVISDEHQAILNVVASILPKAEHRHCARHIFALWHKTYRGDELKLQFWKIAKSYNEADYKYALTELEVMNPEAALAFQKYNPHLFCRAFLSTDVNTDAITRNIAETFNGFIINARTKHLLFMLEEIRSQLMQRMVKKRQDMEKTTTYLCPRIQSKLDKEKNKAAYCEVLPSSDTLSNVSYNLDQVVVNLEAKTCTCRKWDMLGIPCCHAVACVFFANKEAEQFVHPCYRREVYLTSYAVKGHNKRRCPNRDTAIQSEPPAKRARGRPKKNGEQPHSTLSAPCEPQLNTTAAAQHHIVTAQPTQLGRGGRAIRGGRGSRGQGTRPSSSAPALTGG